MQCFVVSHKVMQNARHIPRAPRTILPASQYGHRATQKRGAETGVSGAEKRKLVFSAFTPHGSKEKICLTYFEICQTYFKIQGTYFLSPGNPFENRAENADKYGCAGFASWGRACVRPTLRALFSSPRCTLRRGVPPWPRRGRRCGVLLCRRWLRRQQSCRCCRFLRFQCRL